MRESLSAGGALPRIGCYAAEYYYIDHLVSIWQALPVEARGPWWITEKGAHRLEFYGIPREAAYIAKDRTRLTSAVKRSGDSSPLLTASYGEWKQVRSCGLSAPYMPHGQGGGGNAVEATWRRHAHELPVMFCAAERGKFDGLNCVPLDGQPKVERWLGHRPNNQKPVIAISFRWRESTCALVHYKRHLASFIQEARERGWEVLGHGHPLAWQQRFKPLWKSLGVQFTGDFEKVQRIADVYCADASSTSFEFLATDRPVVFLDAPVYDGRREIMWHRFSHAYGGVTCTEPTALADAVAVALEDPPEQRALRAKAIREIFGANDGAASKRAADYLLELYRC